MSFGYVVGVDGAHITLNLKDSHRGQAAGHRDGVSSIADVGGLFGIDTGARMLVLRVQGLSFVEPKDAHRSGVATTDTIGEPLRQVSAVVIGSITRSGNDLRFGPDSLLTPPLGTEAYPLGETELACILRAPTKDGPELNLGRDLRGGGRLTVSLSAMLGRHVAVLGSTGQGKSCFTAAILQQILNLPSPRIVVFDVNGEYADALKPHCPSAGQFKHTRLGEGANPFRIPYYALGRHGLSRLLLPSEKTQRPALAFALENLRYTKWFPREKGVGLASDSAAVLFDDCRQNGNAITAATALDRLRSGGLTEATEWPPMQALACLAAESHSIKQGRNGPERDSFLYGNVAPLLTRIWRCIDDPRFSAIVDTSGGAPRSGAALDWQAEGGKLVEDIFGGSTPTWKLHIVDLRSVAHDLMPLVLGALLELLAFELFRRGQDASYPTLLVLEEAHHYLRTIGEPEDAGRQALAYERLAKEGRKFGLGLWVSTQRPSEVSSTVLAQCGTWAVLRLTADSDLKAVASAGEWVDRQELSRIAGLPRQQAVVFGASVPLPVRVEAPTADPIPKSKDPDFRRWDSPTPPPTTAPLTRPPPPPPV
jgi:hypothetical protein